MTDFNTLFKQPKVYKPETAQKARDRVVESVRRSNADWVREHGYPALVALCRRLGPGERLTVEDLWTELAARKAPDPREGRAVGALMVKGRSLGLIRSTPEHVQGTRVMSHARPVRVWTVCVR